MKEIKPIIAANLAALRKEKKLTQAELAEKFNYSDKAISRWERGDTMPDIEVLYELCNFYGVTLDYLVSEDETRDREKFKARNDIGNRIAMSLLMVVMVWLVATLVFGFLHTFRHRNFWQVFIWAIPGSCAAFQRTARSWAPKILKIVTSSLLVWTTLLAIYIQLLHFRYNFWLLFVVGVPAQIIVVLWSNIRSGRR